MIQDRIQKLAFDYYKSISDHSKPIYALCVLKGAAPFFNDFIDCLKNLTKLDDKNRQTIFVEYVRLKSYKNTESVGKVTLIGMPNLDDLKDKNVLIVEDIIDTGNTIKKLLNSIKAFKPSKVVVCTLILKETSKAIIDRYVPELCAFIIPDFFIIGYGMDFNEYFRDLEHICIISDIGIKRYSEN